MSIFFDAVECYHVKFPHGFVVFRRISRCYDHPSGRQLLIAEGLALQELQHHRRERLGNTVDLIEEQNALFDAVRSISRYTEAIISLIV